MGALVECIIEVDDVLDCEKISCQPLRVVLSNFKNMVMKNLLVLVVVTSGTRWSGSLLSSRDEQHKKLVFVVVLSHTARTSKERSSVRSAGGLRGSTSVCVKASESVGGVRSSIRQTVVNHSHVVPHSRSSVLSAECRDATWS